jgi:hypothetical protein
MEGFGKSKKNFNAADMFGVAPVDETSVDSVENHGKDINEKEKGEETKQTDNTRYA